MVDIQSPTDEIRQGKKRRRKKKPQHENIYGLPYYIGRPQLTPRQFQAGKLALKQRNTITTLCLRKNCANFFLSELCQISTNFGNFWQKDGKEAKIMQGALNFHLA